MSLQKKKANTAVFKAIVHGVRERFCLVVERHRYCEERVLVVLQETTCWEACEEKVLSFILEIICRKIDCLQCRTSYFKSVSTSALS